MGLNALDKMGRYLFAVFLFLISFPLKIQGAWVGPTDVVVGSWGSEVGQFEVEHGDTVDVFPSEIGVDKNGFILIADLVNKRVQIFKSDGSIYRVINKPSDVNVMMWPRSLRVLPNGDSFLGNLYIYNYSGDIVYKINISKSERFSIQDFFLIKNLDNNTSVPRLQQ